MLSIPLRHLALAAALAAPTFASASLPTGLSGSWYNPAQAGTGFSIQMLSSTHALVFWYATDPQGNPFNLYIEARFVDGGLVGRALAPRGLRFGEWDRDDLQAPDWGEVRIDFLDCEAARVNWVPDGEAGAGFPPGEMPLRRLTWIDGNRCDFHTHLSGGVAQETAP
jgi:hypothetical protein